METMKRYKDEKGNYYWKRVREPEQKIEEPKPLTTPEIATAEKIEQPQQVKKRKRSKKNGIHNASGSSG